MSAEQSVRALVELGFTGLEAEIYTALARHSRMTAYRVAQLIGKPAANVYAKAYEPLSIREAEVFVHPEGRAVVGRWPGQWLNVAVDGREHLLALLTRDGRGVQQAVWSASTYLSWV